MCTGGTQIDLFDRLHVNADVQYVQWSEAKSPFLNVENEITGDGLERLGLGTALDAPGHAIQWARGRRCGR